MSDEKNRSFLNEYEKFRTLLRTVFFFGSFTIDDFLLLEDLGIKKTQYQNYKIIAEDIIERVSSHKEHNKAALKYDVEEFEQNYNFLCESYFIKTLTALEACMTIIILLTCGNIGCTEQDILDCLDLVDEKTIKSKLKKMIESGLIVQDDSLYRLAHNPLPIFSENDFLHLLCFIDFQKSRIYPTCFGAFLFSTLRSFYEKKYSCTYVSPFVMKSNHLGNILDDEIQWGLLQAIYSRQTVSFHYKNNGNRFNLIHSIIPYRLVTEGQQNRVYLFGIRQTSRGDEKRFYRLDKISQLRFSGEIPEYCSEAYMSAFYQNAVQDSFSHIPISSQDTIELQLKYDPSMRTELARQFSSISFDDQTHIAVVSVRANDNALNPWLRSYADRISILNDCSIKASFDQEMKELKTRYGIIS